MFLSQPLPLRLGRWIGFVVNQYPAILRIQQQVNPPIQYLPRGEQLLHRVLGHGFSLRPPGLDPGMQRKQLAHNLAGAYMLVHSMPEQQTLHFVQDDGTVWICKRKAQAGVNRGPQCTHFRVALQGNTGADLAFFSGACHRSDDVTGRLKAQLYKGLGKYQWGKPMQVLHGNCDRFWRIAGGQCSTVGRQRFSVR